MRCEGSAGQGQKHAPHEGEALALAVVALARDVDVADLAVAVEQPAQVRQRRVVRNVVHLQGRRPVLRTNLHGRDRFYADPCRIRPGILLQKGKRKVNRAKTRTFSERRPSIGGGARRAIFSAEKQRFNQSETHRPGFDSSAVLSIASMQAA